jgi:hypothetical protein
MQLVRSRSSNQLTRKACETLEQLNVMVVYRSLKQKDKIKKLLLGKKKQGSSRRCRNNDLYS